jgi:RNA polymerase sigma factor (sigma-70 family)
METMPAKKTQPLARGSLRMQSDSRLVKLFRKGVEPAFDELVRRYRSALVAYAGAIAGRDHAEDVVQESLVKAHRSLSGDGQIEPKPWLYTVVRNTALNDIRDNSKHRHDDLGDEAGRVEQPDEAFERRERLAAVVAAVADLPDSQRQALTAHELGGFSHQEIASQLELTTGATKQLIYRARLTLRNAVGAMIPFPLIAWLASDTVGVVAAGSASGAAAGGGGVLASLAGTGAAKIAVVAVVAGGSLTAGLAVEQNQRGGSEAAARQAEAPAASSESPSGGSGTGLALAPGDDRGKSGDGSGSSGKGQDSRKDGKNGSGEDDRGERPDGGSGDDSPGRDDSVSGSGSGGGGDDWRPSGKGEHGGSSGSGSDDDGHSGSGGDDRHPPSSGGSSGESGDDDYRPGGNQGSGGSGSYRPPPETGDDDPPEREEGGSSGSEDSSGSGGSSGSSGGGERDRPGDDRD